MKLILECPDDEVVCTETLSLAINLACNSSIAQTMCRGAGLKLLMRRALKTHDPLLMKVIRNIARHDGPTKRMFLVCLFPPFLGMPIPSISWYACSLHFLVCLFPPFLGMPIPSISWYAYSLHFLVCLFPPFLGMPIPSISWYAYSLLYVWRTNTICVGHSRGCALIRVVYMDQVIENRFIFH